MKTSDQLLVGEVFIDFTVATNTTPCKMRLGGIVHAARGLWACGIPYSVAAICPAYILSEVKDYLSKHGCKEFIHLGNVTGSPNLIVIGDAREVADQGYEDVLRDTKRVEISQNKNALSEFQTVTLFPGRYDIGDVLKSLSQNAQIIIDIAYNFTDKDLSALPPSRIRALVTSTSSDLFQAKSRDNVDYFPESLKKIDVPLFLLKENRGGSRLFDLIADRIHYIPSVLGSTVNSVGVGDVYTAAFSGFLRDSPETAAWRGMQAATSYAQTTFPDDFKASVTRDIALPIEIVKGLGGVQLPWHERSEYNIYLAAPDFSYIDKREIDEAVRSLQYHNFKIRRPIQENGEATQGADTSNLLHFYTKDLELLEQCVAVFSIPLNRDPGTLIETGWAIAKRKPVITFDPRKENNNTMVMCGSDVYSSDLDTCLNGLFNCVSKLRVP
ncbi:nucleoside 2-deoxyribosyltransferase [Pleomorphomonas oryzae]|uniref:nucleoside 2-deoxyribosyltransferase n=1 Tax=Pleomorphomonas oryzae TaxID=261934 RepID=UPI000407BFA1|nr:nucleoside 2-deoxyribosyltransferase [Pleomorphomonas oryzae]